MDDSQRYDKAMPALRDHVEKFERVFSRVRREYGGHPFDEIHAALLKGFESEGLTVWSEVIEDAARQIARQAETGASEH